MSLEDVLGAIELDIREGVARALRLYIEARGTELASTFRSYDPDASHPTVVAFTQATDALVHMIAAREGVQSATPMAELWINAIERKHGPLGITSPVTKRGDIDILFDAVYGDVAERFGREVNRDAWFKHDHRGIEWAAFDWFALAQLAGDVDAELGADDEGGAADDEWQDVLANGYLQDAYTGFVWRPYETEQGDILLVPDGMVNVSDADDEEVEVENADAYWSWPKDAIPNERDPRIFGFVVADRALGIVAETARVWGKVYREMVQNTSLDAPVAFAVWVVAGDLNWSTAT